MSESPLMPSKDQDSEKRPGKLLLIDGNSLMNRAFYALPRFTNSAGMPTNAIYGFVRMLVRLLEDEKPERVAVAFDRKAPTFRHLSYAGYKAQRAGMPDDLGVQVPVLKEVIRALGLRSFEIDGYEADDIIATLASGGEKLGFAVVIVTGDRDALQLVSPNVRVLLTRRGITDVTSYDEEAVRQEYGTGPEGTLDIKGLTGDSSDNLPGVPGIGPKTAAKLISEFGSLESLLDNLDAVKEERLRKLLLLHGERALMTKKLAAAVKDVPLERGVDACARMPVDFETARCLFEELEFKSLVDALERICDRPPPPEVRVEDTGDEPEVISLEEPDALECLVREMGETKAVALEAVVEGFPEADGRLAGLALYPGESKVYFFSETMPSRLEDVLAEIMEREDISKIACDVKPLIVSLASRGISFSGLEFDAAIAAYLLDPTRSSYDLESLSREFGGPRLPSRDEVLGRGRGMRHLSELASIEAARYLGSRAHALWGIAEPMRRAVREAGMERLFDEVEIPLCTVLADMEKTGVAADSNRLRDLGKEFGARIDDVSREIWALSGEEFNINSTRQLGAVLFEKLKLPVIKKTKTGFSTDSEVLEALAAHHDIALKILEYRQLVKLKGTYVDGLSQVISPRTGRVHSTFHQTVAATGRISSSEPNLQNIPVRMEMGRRIRGVFMAGEDMVLVSGDYSQIELRVMAHLSGDPILIDAFFKGEDIHARTASEVFGAPLDEVTPEMRSRAKAVNFGIIYGMSDFGLARDIGVSRAEARRYIEGYFARYAGVKEYIGKVLEEARETGYVKTLLDRRRPMNDLGSRNPAVRKFAERTAINTPIQGSAADIIKLAMVRIHKKLREKGMRSRMILQVHDELIFEAPRDETEDLCELVRSEMEGAYDMRVPLKVDLKSGADWYNMAPCG